MRLNNKLTTGFNFDFMAFEPSNLVFHSDSMGFGASKPSSRRDSEWFLGSTHQMELNRGSTFCKVQEFSMK